jgi:hypothetical protein
MLEDTLRLHGSCLPDWAYDFSESLCRRPQRGAARHLSQACKTDGSRTCAAAMSPETLSAPLCQDCMALVLPSAIAMNTRSGAVSLQGVAQRGEHDHPVLGARLRAAWDNVGVWVAGTTHVHWPWSSTTATVPLASSTVNVCAASSKRTSGMHVATLSLVCRPQIALSGCPKPGLRREPSESKAFDFRSPDSERWRAR